MQLSCLSWLHVDGVAGKPQAWRRLCCILPLLRVIQEVLPEVCVRVRLWERFAEVGRGWVSFP